ncbi:hypothetical protein [Paraburkholderia terrae]|uniref:hypothetical protein n=1 Tax=Paraburkholderia terrae TaxID=311230 RepID=UPI0020BF8CEB|nr:hypothetical protein [Paraburkholderia terrae]
MLQRDILDGRSRSIHVLFLPKPGVRDGPLLADCTRSARSTASYQLKELAQDDGSFTMLHFSGRNRPTVAVHATQKAVIPMAGSIRHLSDPGGSFSANAVIWLIFDPGPL